MAILVACPAKEAFRLAMCRKNLDSSAFNPPPYVNAGFGSLVKDLIKIFGD
jgi:hypothetical protein